MSNRIAFRIVHTFRLALLMMVTYTIVYGMSRFSPSTRLNIILVVSAVAAIVYTASCVYHVIRLVQFETQRKYSSASE